MSENSELINNPSESHDYGIAYSRKFKAVMSHIEQISLPYFVANDVGDLIEIKTSAETLKFQLDEYIKNLENRITKTL